MNVTLKSVGSLMVQIPGGTVEMRDDRTNKQWQVHMNPFLLCSIPVTQDLYEELTGVNPSRVRGSRRPVETVSWIDSVQFCNLLSGILGFTPYYEIEDSSKTVKVNQVADGFRLPSEAEWQYSCQAGSNSARYGDLDEIAWYKDNSGGSTREVGKKVPNDWGLYDMLGNVWEWCSDLYDPEEYGTFRIFRGGGWSDEERSVMATTRRRSHPVSFRIDDLGFRIARNIDLT